LIVKHFPIIRTRRLTIQLKELTIGESVALAAIPSQSEQAACSAFLKCAVQSVSGIEDPAQWTVQERMLAVAQYLAAVLDDGPDFSIGAGHYSDYLDGAADILTESDSIYVGDVGGDKWHMTHLTGRMAESIERLQGELGIPNKLHWQLGVLAAQLINKNAPRQELSTDGQYDEWLLAQMHIFSKYPESDFEQLMLAYHTGKEKLHHLFNINFNDNGIVALPRKGADGSLPPAWFPIRSGLSRIAFALGG
jgi:hypothetical protein